MNKQQIKLIVAVAALVLLIIAASLLYSNLSGKYRPNSLVTRPNENEATPESGGISVDTSEGSIIPGDSAADPSDNTSDAADSSADTSEDYSAPDFTVYNGAGEPVKLSDHIGKPVIVNFWASWCPPCKSEMPDFEAAYKEHGDEIVFMMINVTDGSSETVETASAFIESAGYTFPVYFDTALEASIAYGASSIPMTFFVDADGNIKAYGMGMLDAESLNQGIKMLFE